MEREGGEQVKELVGLLVQITTARLKKEQESSVSEETIKLLQLLVHLGAYL